MKILGTNCSNTSILNYRFFDSLSSVLNGTGDWNQLDSEMPEVFLLTKVAVRWGVTSDINNFLVELIRMVKHNVSVKRTVYGKKLNISR